jgi:hypothetical protein
MVSCFLLWYLGSLDGNERQLGRDGKGREVEGFVYGDADGWVVAPEPRSKKDRKLKTEIEPMGKSKGEASGG